MNIFQKLKSSIFNNKLSSFQYWEHRAIQYGKRAMINIGHPEEELPLVTQMQKNKLYPLLKGQLKGSEKTILDFGCGVGRFTLDLANMIDGKAIGVDPIKHFIDLAPKNVNVEYRLMTEYEIPIDDSSIDIVWICLVLGGIINENTLTHIISELKRVSKDNSLIFLVENTSKQKDVIYWKFRAIDEYIALFNFVELKHISDYFDLGECNSIMTGRVFD